MILNIFRISALVGLVGVGIYYFLNLESFISLEESLSKAIKNEQNASLQSEIDKNKSEALITDLYRERSKMRQNIEDLENNIEKLGDLILEEGSKLGMIITATPSFRGRRIEAGLLSAGQDFTKDTNPFSVGLGRFVDLQKDNFIGKKALIKADKECRSWGIRVVDGIAKKGRFIKLNNNFIGKITSSTWSPYQVCGVGIVLLDKSDVGPGTVVDVECTDEKIHKAELCKLPMYDPKGEIVRGIDKKIPTKAEPWSGIKS